MPAVCLLFLSAQETWAQDQDLRIRLSGAILWLLLKIVDQFAVELSIFIALNFMHVPVIVFKLIVF